MVARRLSQWLKTLDTCIVSVCGAAMLMMALVILATTLLRYAFAIGFPWLQEMAIYANAVVVLLPAGAVLAANKHVRVDTFLAGASPKWRAMVDLLGSLLFLLPFCSVLIVEGLPYAWLSWMAGEGSAQPSGLPGVYLLKYAIVAGAGLLALQGFAFALQAIAVLLAPSSDHRNSA